MGHKAFVEYSCDVDHCECKELVESGQYLKPKKIEYLEINGGIDFNGYLCKTHLDEIWNILYPNGIKT